MKSIIVISLGAIALFTSGCATVQRGTKMDIPISSNPSKAEVKLSTGQSGITPVTFTLKRNETVQVIISKEGYKTQTFTLSPTISLQGVASGSMNLILGGVVGIGIDAVSGANLDLSPNHIYAELTPKEGFVPETEAVTRIIEGVTITEGEVKCPLNVTQLTALSEKIKEIDDNMMVVEWGTPFKTKSIIGLSSNTYVAFRVKTSGKHSLYECMINSDGQLYKIREAQWKDINRPWDGFIRTENVTLN
jgi:hypothetical protein